jgi:hypothetical protein
MRRVEQSDAAFECSSAADVIGRVIAGEPDSRGASRVSHIAGKRFRSIGESPSGRP